MTSKDRKSVYEMVTERIVAQLDKGIIPWRRTWAGDAFAPRNVVSGKPYRGINIWLTLSTGYSSPLWMTFKQAQGLGGSVKRGEHGTMVVFWKIEEKEQKDPKTGAMKKRTVPFLRYFTVFNLEQTEGVKLPKKFAPVPEKPREERLEQADSIAESYLEREVLKLIFGAPAYDIKGDRIRMPKAESFEDRFAYLATLFHEMTHSTGAEKRLDRPGIKGFDFFGSHQYSQEELVAEFGASFLCSVAGMGNSKLIENQTAYIQHWSRLLKADPKLIVRAAQQAQKAAEFILNGKPEEEGGAEPSSSQSPEAPVEMGA